MDEKPSSEVPEHMKYLRNTRKKESNCTEKLLALLEANTAKQLMKFYLLMQGEQMS